MVRQLVPWYVNIGKRQVKAPKIYFRDSGILHLLLGVRTSFELDLHPKVGASWEGFALEQVIKKHNKSSVECFFWSTYSGAEIDLIFLEGGRWYGFEFKRGDVPKRTKSMMIALEELKLEKITVIYPGKENYSLHEKIEVIGLESYILN
jgi:predicted AAA+ superfamily ATPase